MIKEKRKAKRYTQEQVANILGISLRQYVRIDNQEDFPRKDILKKLIQLFNLTNEEIGQYIQEVYLKD